MLDNLGFGEIAMLALMALLFFGPERLPQIGARIGRWIATLTQSSKAFMNEWRDEALVVYDAVEEVKGIRDEIFAARAEIAGTMTTARDDVNDALSGARADVQAQVRGATAFSPTPEGSGEGSIPTSFVGGGKDPDSAAIPPSTSPDHAIERTNKVLAGLRQKRRETKPTVTASKLPASTTFSDDNPLDQSTQHLWHQAAPGTRQSSRGASQPAAALAPPTRAEQRRQLASPPSEGTEGGKRRASPTTPSLSSLHETVIALESDIQSLRDELARTRAALEARTLSSRSEARPRAGTETGTVPHPQPVQAGDQL